MILRKDTFSTQDKLFQTKAVIKELSLTPGNGVMAKGALTPGNAIIPFCASKKMFLPHGETNCCSTGRQPTINSWFLLKLGAQYTSQHYIFRYVRQRGLFSILTL